MGHGGSVCGSWRVANALVPVAISEVLAQELEILSAVGVNKEVKQEKPQKVRISQSTKSEEAIYIDPQIDRQIDRWMDGWIDRWMDG